MIVVGIYRLHPKRTAFRNDYCLTCNDRRLAFEFQTQDAFHIYGIPVLPLGSRKRWHCASCGQVTSWQNKSRPIFLFLGMLIMVGMTIAGWTMAPPPNREDAMFLFRYFAPIGGIAMLVQMIRNWNDRTHELKFAEVEPARDESCPLCRTELLIDDDVRHCPKCEIVRC